MKHAAVIGFPISHSKSPALYSFIADHMKMPLEYEALEVKPDELSEFLKKVKNDPEWIGLNVTIPHKEKVTTILDRLSPDAKSVGAVNVIAHQDSQLVGFNTDTIGIFRTFEKANLDLNKKTVILFGSGGAARAVIYAAVERGATRVIVVNPRIESAQALVEASRVLCSSTGFSAEKSASDIQNLNEGEIGAIVNCTPLGMKGVPQTRSQQSATDYFQCLLDLKKYSSKNTLAFDLIYNPEITPFIEVAKKIGFKTAGGFTMLIEQAIASWQIFTGNSDVLPGLSQKLELYLKKLLSLEKTTRPIYLTGFMGSGKSTVARLLSTRLGWTLIDTDQVVEDVSGMSISEIFSEHGEAHFRDFEKKIIAQTLTTPFAVIALGGGALMDPETLVSVKEAGILVHLSAAPESIEARIGQDNQSRPLLAGLSASERKLKINSMIKARESAYAQADCKIETDDVPATTIANQIIERLATL